MNTLANRQKGWAIGMVGVVTVRTLDDRCQADRDANQGNPESKHFGHCTARSLHIKHNEQAWYINQDTCPEYPAALADL